ncbi:MAG: ferredoxin [Aeromicrobium erythreum]
MSARLLVDWTRCDGHGLCAALLPEQVTLDEWGFPVVGDDLTERQARQLAQVCPALALRVEAARDRSGRT